ncbi:glycoprotein Xg-like [Trichechus inunguis]
MASLRGVPWFLLLGVLIHAGRGQRDFDLADALDDPEPTRKPSSDIYPKPKPPYQPQPGNPDNGGNIYPRPEPQPPRPQPGSHGNSGGYFNDIDHNDGGHPPRPRPPAGGGGGHDPNYDSYGNTHGPALVHHVFSCGSTRPLISSATWDATGCVLGKALSLPRGDTSTPGQLFTA